MNDDKRVEVFLKTAASKNGLHESNEPTGCFCLAKKDWCRKFVGFHDDFYREHCQHCSIQGKFDEEAARRFKEWKAEKEERVKFPKRSWLVVVPDGNIGAKAYE